MIKEPVVIDITDAAKAHIKSMLEEKPQPAYFRLSIKKTGCNGYMYVPDIVHRISELEERVIMGTPFDMIIPTAAKSLLHGTKIDFVIKQFGMTQLAFAHPDAEGVCGCGESFNFKKSESDD